MENSLKEFLKYLVEFQWQYVAYALPVFVVILLFYLKNKKAISQGFHGFMGWLRPSFETGGTASPEKLTAFAITSFAYIPGRLIFAIQITDPVHLLYGSIIDGVFVLVLYRIITPQQLADLNNGSKLSESEDAK